jgi:hypothetical protein
MIYEYFGFFYVATGQRSANAEQKNLFTSISFMTMPLKK